MLGRGLLPQNKYDFLPEYRDKIGNNKYPKCSKYMLEWQIL